MDSVERFEVGQAVYITNSKREFAWPALVGDLIAPNYVQLIFNNNESALLEARYVAAFPRVTEQNFDARIAPLPDSFFDASHKSLPTQVPNQASALNELCDDPAAAVRREIESEEEHSDAPMIIETREPAYAKVTIMQTPRQQATKRNSRRNRISSKLTLHNRYHQRIEPAKQQKRCCSVQ